MKSELFKSYSNYNGDGIIYTLHFTELNELRKAIHNLDKKPISSYKRKKATIKFKAFCEWFLNYSKDLTKGKTLSVDKIADMVFSTEEMKITKYKQFLYKSLYAATEYIKYLKNVVTEKNVYKFKDSIIDVFIDYEWLIMNIELYYKELGDDGDSVQLATGSRRSMNTMDMLNSLMQIHYIETLDNITDLYLRDLKPLMIFQIRQLLELLGKNIIGYDKITDKGGIEIKKFTQVSWDFIKKENGKKAWLITFPCQLSSIDKINNWANSFVHTTYFYNCYVRYFAITLINELFRPPKEYVKLYSGKRSSSLLFGDIRIKSYEIIKADFEEFIKEKMPTAQICWNEVDTVHAYIESL